MEIELVRIAQFVARVYLLFKHAQVVPDHHYLVKECLQRHLFWLQGSVGGLHDQGAALPAIREAFDDAVRLFQTERLDHALCGLADQNLKRNLKFAQRRSRFRAGEIARRGRDCARRVIERDLGGVFGEGAHHAHAVARVQDFHSDVEAVNSQRHRRQSHPLG